MKEVLEFAILGFGIAAAYTLLGQGLVVIYRGSGILNFAQGAFAMVGAYVFYELHFVVNIVQGPAKLDFSYSVDGVKRGEAQSVEYSSLNVDS